MTAQYKLTTKYVNSKPLLEIVKELELIFTDFAIIWDNKVQRETAIETIEEMMEMLHEENKISQWNVICDSRNNTISGMNEGKYFLTVKYRQINCLNTTELNYDIRYTSENGQFEIEF